MILGLRRAAFPAFFASTTPWPSALVFSATLRSCTARQH